MLVSGSINNIKHNVVGEDLKVLQAIEFSLGPYTNVCIETEKNIIWFEFNLQPQQTNKPRSIQACLTGHGIVFEMTRDKYKVVITKKLHVAQRLPENV